MWRGERSNAVILFLANRYLTLAYYVYLIVDEFLPLEVPTSQVRSELFLPRPVRIANQTPRREHFPDRIRAYDNN